MVSLLSPVLQRMDITQLIRNILKSLPASMVISLNAWAVSAWLKATILINSQPRWLFRKKRWSESEMRAISCYYLVVAYLVLRIVRITSRLTKRPGRPYGDFFRHTRPLLGAVAVFSIATMLVDEFVMFYILRKFGLEKRRIMMTGRPLDKEIGPVTDDDCCICYGAMLDDEDVAETEAFMGSFGEAGMLSKETDHVLENFCVVKSHVAHRGCIRKWYNYGPKGYRPLDTFRVFQWATGEETAGPGTEGGRGEDGTAMTGFGVNLPHRLILGPRNSLGWLLSLPLRHGSIVTNEQLRIPLYPEDHTAIPTITTTTAAAANAEAVMRDNDAREGQAEITSGSMNETTDSEGENSDSARTLTNTPTTPAADQQQQQQQAPVNPPQPRQQENEYTRGRNAGRNTCPACRQQLILNFVDLAKGRQEMTRLEKLWALGHDLTKFSDWRGLFLRSAITAGWVSVTIVGGKLRMKAIDRSVARHQRNRGLASLSSAATAAGATLAMATSLDSLPTNS